MIRFLIFIRDIWRFFNQDPDATTSDKQSF
jgi:hypothetical protein